MYIYMERERERQTEREMYNHLHRHIPKRCFVGPVGCEPNHNFVRNCSLGGLKLA